MATIAFVRDHLDIILLILLATSEWLSMNRKVRANGVLQLLIQIVRALMKDTKAH